LLELLTDAAQPPRVCDFQPAEVEAVLGGKAWKRLLPALANLAKLKLLTPAKKGGDDGETWGQCHPAYVSAAQRLAIKSPC
jgi:hypothetical protein